MRIGLYFGSFNPVHIGHLVIAEAAAEAGGFDQVWLVVSPQSPFKSKPSLLNEHDRLRLVELAVADNPRLEASNVEYGLPRPSYTIDTLDALERQFPSYQFSLVMGGDNLPTLPRWKAYDRLRHYPIYVYPRPGESLDGHDLPHLHVIPSPLMDVSATAIRQRLQAGQSVRYLLPEPVRQYIADHGLYR